MSSVFLGHNRQVDFLDKSLKNKRLAHAYLFYGPESVGKLTLAKNLAKVFCCSEKPKTLNEICQHCSGCLTVESGSHPQVIVLDPEHTLVSKKDKRKDIPIEDIRELKRRLSLAPQAGQWRIAIINQADKMSKDAANAFLKLLEEPGEKTLLLLISSDPELLLPTIISRSQPVRFSQVLNRILEEFLKTKVRDEKTRKEILTYAFGRPGAMFKMLTDEKSLKDERALIKKLDSLISLTDFPEIFLYSEQVSPDEALRAKTIEYVTRIVRKKLIGSIPKDNLLPLIEKLKRMDKISTIMETTNVNPRLALDVFLLEAKS